MRVSIRTVAFVVLLATGAKADYLEVRRAATIKNAPQGDATIHTRPAVGANLRLLNDGQKQNGYYKVAIPAGSGTAATEGWIYKSLVRRFPGDPPEASLGGSATTLPPTASSGGTSAAQLEIVHLNIGQGDSTLILGPETNGSRISVLIDAGDRSKPDGGKIVYAELIARGIRTLDFFIATHYDADHIGGVATRAVAHETVSHGTSFVLGPDGVPGSLGDDDNDGESDFLDRFEVDASELGRGDDIKVLRYVDRGAPSANPTQTANASGNRTMITSVADVEAFDADLGSGASLMCLSGNGFVRGRTTVVPDVDTENEKSLCFLLSYKGFHYLIGGDTIGRAAGSENAEVEGAIAEYLDSESIKVDALKVNHHGADNGSADGFLATVRPEIAFISAGNRNTHAHPRLGAMARLAAAGTQWIYCTKMGNTVWDDTVLAKSESQLTQADKDKVAELKDVRKRLITAQGHVTLRTDGVTYEVSLPVGRLGVDGRLGGGGESDLVDF